MRYRKFGLPVAFALVAGLVLVFGNAASGRSTTIFTVPACNSTIVQNTTLTGDMTCSASANALTIGAPGITLNLNGHTITGNGSYACVYDDEYNNVTITGGTFAGCDEGAYIEYSSGVTVSNTKSSGSTTVSYGVYSDYSSIAVKGNSWVDPADYGIYTEYDAGDTVTKNTVTFTSTTNAYGFADEDGNGNTFSTNTVTGPTGGSSYGFWSYEANNTRFISNSATGGEYGYYAECDEYGTVYVNGNVSDSTSSDGFYVEECENQNGDNYNDPTFTTVTNNLAGHAGGYGFDEYFNTNAIWTGNTAARNDDGGFYFEESPGEVITGNTAKNNDSDGFYFDSMYNEYAPKTVSKDISNNNNGYGFSDDDYPVAATSLSGSGNANGCSYNIGGC